MVVPAFFSLYPGTRVTAERANMAARRNWTWDETLEAFALYFLLPSGQHHKGNKDVIALANRLGRTPSSVVLKLANIKANDPMQKGKGMVHGSKLDALVWEEYSKQGDSLTARAADLLIDDFREGPSPGVALDYLMRELPEGKERKTETTRRMNQTYFRNSLLEIYGRSCCVSGLSVEPLLVASHIKPWSVADPVTERLAPDNGLLLDALHDKAFDKGLMTIDFDLRVVISPKVPKDDVCQELLWRYQGQQIRQPRRFKPRRDFIEYHNDVIFQR